MASKNGKAKKQHPDRLYHIQDFTTLRIPTLLTLTRGTRTVAENESFLDLYMRFTEKQESPAMFHLWTGITLVATALGRKCYLDKGFYTLYPNIFCILVAGSARCRKSTAINIGVDLFKDAAGELPESIKVISGKITPEKFIHEIADASKEVEAEVGKKTWETPAILVHASELSVFLTKQSYGEPLIHILTDLFDCPDRWPYKTKNKGEAFLRNVFICIIAATTPDGIAQGIPASALQEGFASRILFVYQRDTDRRNAFPVLSTDERKLRERLKAKLLEINSIKGQFMLTKEAHDWYEAWYAVHMSEAPPDKRLEGVYGRKHDHILRLGMILAGSVQSKVVDVHHLEAGKLAIESLEQLTAGAFAEIGGDDTTQHLTRAMAFLKHYKRMPYSMLLQKMYPCDALRFKGVLETLIQSGRVRRDVATPTVLEWIDP